MIRIAFFGLPLAALLLSSDGFEPRVAVLSPTPAPGRRRLVRALGARVVDARAMTPSALDRTVDARLKSLELDLVVSWYWTRRLPMRWLESARLGGIGAHPSLLPRHRGPDPFFWAIDAGDTVTGVSIHRLTERYDEGAVIRSEPVDIAGRNAWQLARALDRPSLRLLRSVVRDFASGAMPPSAEQDESLATWAPAPTGELLHVDFRASTERVLRRIRALAPVPGVGLAIFGLRFTVSHAEAAAEYPRALEPGEAALDDGGVIIRTGDGAVRITRAWIDTADSDETASVDARALAVAVGRAKERTSL